VFFIFIDGFGIREDKSINNPFFYAKLPILNEIKKDYIYIPTDACIGVKGLPQSATGQTTIFTGKNASKVLGRHMQGQPTITLKNLIYENNLFQYLIDNGYKVTNANIYSKEYLSKMLDEKNKRVRPSVTSVMTLSSNIKFRTVENYDKKRGVYHDITGEILKKLNRSTYEINENIAAGNLSNLKDKYDFILFEHFMCDIIGHSKNMELAIKELEKIDRFIGELLNNLDLNNDSLIITSDHGNIEDLSVKTHTKNKVPTIIINNNLKKDKFNIKSLLDIFKTVDYIMPKK
jgi:bisphosphoglycerate-independent phosphoglycerate mutase (AlkP superfamily)